MPECPSHEELRAFSLGLLPEGALARVSDHTETCTQCLAALSTIDDADDSLLSAIRTSSEGDSLLDDSGCREAVTQFEQIGFGRTRATSAGREPAADLPRKFGRYELLEELGHGGMGTVYLARDTQLDRHVALKIPHFGPEDNPTLRERFYREARSAASIDHANLCPVYDVGEIDGLPYLSMAHIQGRPLSKLLKSHANLSEEDAAELVRKLALALAEAHAHGVVHRDVKPSNVMISEEGEPILTDFGLARRIELSDPRLTHSGLIVGTPTYMAPEQVDRDPDTIDPRCDIYSLGVVLYEALTGEVPFRGPLLSVLTKLGKDEPQPPSRRRPGLDPRLEQICLKAMAKRPAERYQSAAELADALQRYLHSPLRPQHTPPRRAWFLLLAAAAAAGGVLWLAAVVIRIETAQGTLVLTVDQSDVQVTIDGNRVRIQSPRDEITVKVGRHELEVCKDGFYTFTDAFTIRRDGKTELTVRLEPIGDLARFGRDGFPDPGLFGDPMPARDLPATISVTVAGDYMVYSRGAPHRIYCAAWNETRNAWTTAEQLSLGSGGGGWECHPSLSPDGKWLFYVASDGDPLGGPGPDQIFRSVRQPDGSWAPGEPLRGEVHSVGHLGAPAFADKKLYLARWVSTTRRDLYVSEYDSADDTFAKPQPLTTINDGSQNDQPWVSSDGRTLLFTSDRAGTDDIWMATWNETTGDWSQPVKPDWPVNTEADEYSAWYSPGRATLYFNRDGAPYECSVDRGT